MKTKLTFSFLPPSVNSIWRYAKGGKVYRTKEYLAWSNGEAWQLNRQMAGQHRFTGPVYLVIAMRRPRSNADIDNRLKGLIDLLQQVGAIANDKLVMGVNAYWSATLPVGVAAEIAISEADALEAA